MLNFPPWKIALTLMVCFVSIGMTLVNFLDKNDVLPNNRIKLGLDLRGGSYLLLEVEFESYLLDQLAFLQQDIRKSLRGMRINNKPVRYNGGIRIANRHILLTPSYSEQIDELINHFESLSKGVLVTNQQGTLQIGFNQETIDSMQIDVVSQSMEIIRRRIDELGTTEPDIQRQGNKRILLQVPGLKKPDQLKQLLGKTAKLTFHLLHPDYPYGTESSVIVPPGYMKLYEDSASEGRSLSVYIVEKYASLTGDLLVDAQPTFSQGESVVNFRFNQLGAKTFSELTRKHVGKPFAIVLDTKVISAPVIREPILGGSGQISGQFTVDTANELAILLRAGALPAPLSIVEERTIGPSLGQDSIHAGLKAFIVGIILVMAFMLIAYRRFGLFATIAMIINVTLLLAILSFLNATLTLPGIAGIILTLGMAIDANILIFERIYEEHRNGKSPFASIDHGFKQAFTTILDANITTLIAAILLFNFGSGPIKGFAVTLSVGIISSMFCALMLTRMMIIYWAKRQKKLLF